MFTGLVDHCGELMGLERESGRLTFSIKTAFSMLVLGESIALDGVCLTVTSVTPDGFSCEISPETEQLTTLGQYPLHHSINLERALSLQDRLGGHFVMGHVDQTLEVSDLKKEGDFWRFDFSGVKPEHAAYLIPKGSVAINGVSLTINAVSEEGFSVMLIPHTLERTNLQNVSVGKQVNVEYDYLAKCAARQMQHHIREVLE